MDGANQQGKDTPEKTTASETNGQEKTPRIGRRLATAGGTCALVGFCLFFLSVAGYQHFIQASTAGLVFCVVAILLGLAALFSMAYEESGGRGRVTALAVVVIAVIIVGTCAPASQLLREKMRVVPCLSRLKGLGEAIAAYADDNEGYLPSPESWCDLLTEHDRSIPENMFRCPAEKEGRCHYCFNKNLVGQKFSELPEGTVILFEGKGGWNCTGGPWDMVFRYRKAQACNILFGDGHVECRQATDIAREPLIWEP